MGGTAAFSRVGLRRQRMHQDSCQKSRKREQIRIEISKMDRALFARGCGRMRGAAGLRYISRTNPKTKKEGKKKKEKKNRRWTRALADCSPVNESINLSLSARGRAPNLGNRRFLTITRDAMRERARPTYVWLTSHLAESKSLAVFFFFFLVFLFSFYESVLFPHSFSHLDFFFAVCLTPSA